MRLKTCLITAILLIICAAATWAGDDGVWVGTQFSPEQCLKIVAGKYDAKHKFGTIAYKIQSKNDHFAVNARLRLNKQYIPENVSDVQLQILLIRLAFCHGDYLAVRSRLISADVSLTIFIMDVSGIRKSDIDLPSPPNLLMNYRACIRAAEPPADVRLGYPASLGFFDATAL